MKQPEIHPEDRASILWIFAAYSVIALLAYAVVMGGGP